MRNGAGSLVHPNIIAAAIPPCMKSVRARAPEVWLLGELTMPINGANVGASSEFIIIAVG
jgi:hypothetical protein